MEQATGLLSKLAGCFVDHRDPEKIEHTVDALIKQRVFALTLGYEDRNDHDQLRTDPRQAAGRQEHTLNRWELTPVRANSEQRYKKIAARNQRIERWFVDALLTLNSQPPDEIVLDLDATDDPLHGQQAGRFFHGYYQGYCYLPLYIFCGEHLLYAKFRPADIDAAAGSLKPVQRLVEQLRARWPNVRMILRADSGFYREQAAQPARAARRARPASGS